MSDTLKDQREYQREIQHLKFQLADLTADLELERWKVRIHWFALILLALSMMLFGWIAGRDVHHLREELHKYELIENV